jgi:F-type H+-transporting ATPase subunit alpha
MKLPVHLSWLLWVRMSDFSEKQEEILREFGDNLKDNNVLSIPKDRFFTEVLKEHRPEIVGQKFKKTLTLKTILRKLIKASENIEPAVQFKNVGTVQHIGNGVATLSGLPTVKLEELVTFPNGVQGMVLNLDKKHVDVILLGPDQGIRGGDLTEATGKRLSVPVGVQFLGRVIGPLGSPLDELGSIIPSEYRFIEKIAPGVIDRAPVNEPLYTGTKIIDSLIPLGRGQRELILGDRQTGKTTLALDTILNQYGTDVKCVYVAISQKKTSVITAIDILRKGGVLPQTTVIIASPDDPPALRYLAPYVGVTQAEHLLDQGMDVLIVYDDLSKHADSYRELSLLLRRPPGREAYPGDIFYLHSRLLERACKLNDEHGGGSITALPIVSTQKGNISGYIPTNLISITDGQIMLDMDLFNKGIKPAIDIGRSVSRVGGIAQEPAMKTIVGDLKLELSQYEEVARFSRFGTEVNEATQRQIERGKRLEQLLGQGPHEPVTMVDQVILFFALTKNLLDDVPVTDIARYSHDLLNYVHTHAVQMTDAIKHERSLSQKIVDSLTQVITEYNNRELEKFGGLE